MMDLEYGIDNGTGLKAERNRAEDLSVRDVSLAADEDLSTEYTKKEENEEKRQEHETAQKKAQKRAQRSGQKRVRKAGKKRRAKAMTADERQRMIEDCERIYLELGGRRYKELERRMRELGHRFDMRSLCNRNMRGGMRLGYIAEYGWREKLKKDPREAERRAKGVEFQEWLTQHSPKWNWNWNYQRYIYPRLSRITHGERGRLMVFIPPRHGKSELVTVRYAAWRLLKDPSLRVILASYNQKLANRFSRRVFRIFEELSAKPAQEQAAEPDVRKRMRSASEWETAAGGGVRAVGVGAGITGFGGDLIIIDDPVKSRSEAESETYRERVWNWFNDDLYTRLEPKASMILIQTRWHEDDLSGRLLRDAAAGGEQWDVVCLPALAEGEASGGVGEWGSEGGESRVVVPDPLGRRPGEALCPDRYDRETLLKIKHRLGSYSFSALYQQRPAPAEGGLFKRKWFEQIIDREPEGLRWARGYDLAISTKTSADHTASFRCAFDSLGNLYISGGYRKRMEYPEQRRFVIDRMLTEENTEHGIEKAMHGQAIVQDLWCEPSVRHIPLRHIAVEGDKFTRALAWANLAEAGKVILVHGPWIDDLVDEACRFTGKGDAHDDQIDAISLAVKMLATPRSYSWTI